MMGCTQLHRPQNTSSNGSRATAARFMLEGSLVRRPVNAACTSSYLSCLPSLAALSEMQRWPILDSLCVGDWPT